MLQGTQQKTSRLNKISKPELFICDHRKNVKENGDPNSLFTRMIVVKSTNKSIVIQVKDIIMIKSDSNYSTIYIKNHHPVLTSKTLKHWCDLLNEEMFIRTHASFLINKYEIKEIITGANRIILNNNFIALISRTFLKKQLIFLKNNTNN
jgi:two-component system LytT family response regulator